MQLYGHTSASQESTFYKLVRNAGSEGYIDLDGDLNGNHRLLLDCID